MLMRIQQFRLYIKYLIFKLRWFMLDDTDQEVVWVECHMVTNEPYWDNYAQFLAAMERGDDYRPDWQDLAAYIRGEV